ncbi:hypothetical protein F4778DRAFT_802473 [Xylariomycetidae sp. FL2044]|nr:hypothetical protein F4778DRAFT_802473 [Xylariomycetidae sp. FL2044]
MDGVLPLEKWSFDGRNLPAEDSLVSPPVDDFEVTAHVVNQLRKGRRCGKSSSSNARDIMESCFQLKRLLTSKSRKTLHLPTEKTMNYPDRVKALAIYLTADANNNAPCSSCMVAGPLAECISVENYASGACTNCQYKKASTCSLRMKKQTDEASPCEVTVADHVNTPNIMSGAWSFLHLTQDHVSSVPTWALETWQQWIEAELQKRRA